MTWLQLLEQFSQARGLSPHTLRGYRHALRLFDAFTGETTPLNVTNGQLTAYYLAQKTQPSVSLATAISRVRPLLVLLRWAVRQELLAFDPAHDLRLPKPRRPIPSILTREQIDALFEAAHRNRSDFCAARDAALLETMYGIGLRVGEVVSLSLEDIELAEGFVTVRGGKGQPRRTPVGPSVVQALEAYLDVRGHYAETFERAFFVSLAGYRMTPSSVNAMVGRYSKELGFTRVSPHALRRAFATHLLENGANIVELKTLMGHADIGSTQHYAQVVPTELMREYRRFHPRASRARRSR